MNENHNIPDHLRYSEEYAHEGIRMLRIARRRRMFWRAGVLGAILTGVIFGWSNHDRTSGVDSSTTLVSVPSSIGAVEPFAGDLLEQKVGAGNNPIQSNKDQLGLNEKTFGQGGSVSSGAESPGRKSTSAETLNASEKSESFLVSDSGVQPVIKEHLLTQDAIEEALDTHAGILSLRLHPMEQDRHVVVPAFSNLSVLNRSLKAQWSLEAGAIVSKGFGTVQDVIHPDYSLRLVYGKPCTQQSQFVASLGLIRISGIDRPVEVTQRTYATGLQERKLTYSTDALYFAEFTAMYSRAITPRWIASAGPSALVLLQGVNHIEEVQSSTMDFPVAHVTETKGYVKGFKSVGFGLRAQAEYAVSERISLGVDASLGFTDMTKVGVFTQENVDRNGYIGCHIRRRLF